MQLYDWQTQCSSQALPDEGLRLSLKRLMPTVGVRPCCQPSLPIVSTAIEVTIPPGMLFWLSLLGLSRQVSWQVQAHA